MSERFCKDCDHFRGGMLQEECHRERRTHVDPVTGKRFEGYTLAYVERVGYSHTDCGPDAQYWTPRPAPWWRRLFK